MCGLVTFFVVVLFSTMYIGPWQEYRLANAFTQPSLERHAQLKQFYGQWQRMCQERGEQAATQALIFDPLFASVAPADADAGRRSAPGEKLYQLEQRSASANAGRRAGSTGSAPSTGKAQWHMSAERGSAVRSAGASVAGGGRRRRRAEYVKHGVRHVQKRKQNYLQSLRRGQDGGDDDTAGASGGRTTPSLAALQQQQQQLQQQQQPQQQQQQQLPSDGFGQQENVPPVTIRFSREPSAIPIEERIITANPKRYVPATDYSSRPSDVQTYPAVRGVVPSAGSTSPGVCGDIAWNASTSRIDGGGGGLPGAEPRPDQVLRHMPSGGPTARPVMTSYQVAAMDAATRGDSGGERGGVGTTTTTTTKTTAAAVAAAAAAGRMSSATPTPRSMLSPTSKQNIEVPHVSAAAAAASPANRTLSRPPTTQSMNSTGSPQIWEQEVDDLLKWTEGLQQSDSDPLDQSWGPGMSP